MRITLFAHGSRGDIWPMVSLAGELQSRDHDVTMAIQDEYRHLAEDAGIPAAHLPFDSAAFLATEEGQHLLRAGGIRFLRAYKRAYDVHADAFADACIAAASGAEALVTVHITWDWALALADKLQIPIATVHVVPVAPSSEYATVLATSGRLRSPVLRRASHEMVRRLWWRSSAPSANAFRAKLGLTPCSTSTFDRLQMGDALGLHTISPSVFPRPADWPAHLKMTGAWQMPHALRSALGEGLDGDLLAWLDAGEAPVFLGFGSMPVLEPARLLDDVAVVTASLGVRALIDASWAGEVELPGHLRAVGALNHDLLLPRCIAAVHHGGVGSVTASTRAGCPTLVCSVLGDQPWWGNRVVQLGVGAHVPFRKLDRERLHQGLGTVLRPDVRERARELGQAIQAEGDGLPEAARILDDWLVTAEPPPPCRGPARRGRVGFGDATPGISGS